MVRTESLDVPMSTEYWRNEMYLTNLRLIPHIGLKITGITPSPAFGPYAPTFVAGFGFDRQQSNALVPVRYWILLFVLVF